MSATCTGCGIDSDKTGAYSQDDPVEADGTFFNGKFVCDKCYARLTAIGLDTGIAEHVQMRAAALLPPAPDHVDLGGERIAVVSSYSLEQAIIDGILIAVGVAGPLPVVFNAECFRTRGLDKDESCEDLKKTVAQGLAALRQPDPEDEPTRRMRVLEKDFWVIFDGLAITFLRSEDY